MTASQVCAVLCQPRKLVGGVVTVVYSPLEASVLGKCDCSSYTRRARSKLPLAPILADTAAAHFINLKLFRLRPQ